MRILLVDDDPDARALAARAVGQEFEGAEVLQAGDPSTLEKQLGAPPDVLVTDYMLRWSDGFAVHESVRAVARDCCTVMFTGTGNEELAVRAMKAGFDDYLVKSPHQLRRLAAAVRAAYERRREVRELERHRELLLRELYHRLHNNLQIVISLVRRTAKTMSLREDRVKLEDLNRRIQAISMVQEEFYRAERIDAVPFDGYLLRLAQDHVAIAEGVELDSELEPVTVSVAQAVPLALIANELLTNALKHGFAEERTGRVRISLLRQGKEAVLRVSEDGSRGALPAGEHTPHLGMELMNGLARQMNAQISTRSSPEGWATAVTFTP